MFGLFSSAVAAFTTFLGLPPASDWARLSDMHIGVACFFNKNCAFVAAKDNINHQPDDDETTMMTMSYIVCTTSIEQRFLGTEEIIIKASVREIWHSFVQEAGGVLLCGRW